jgi:hypothetical protein
MLTENCKTPNPEPAMTTHPHALPYPAPGPRVNFERESAARGPSARAARGANYGGRGASGTRSTGRAPLQTRLRSRRRRVRRIRLGGVAVAVAVFLALWGVIFAQLVTGHTATL